MARSYAISRGYNSHIYKTDNLDRFVEFLKQLLSEENECISNGTEYDIKILEPTWDANGNETQGEEDD